VGLRTFTDLLGRGVKVVSSIPFDQCVAERIAKPIALSSDTSFYVPAEKAGRIGEPQVDPTANKQPPLIDVTSRPNCLSGRPRYGVNGVGLRQAQRDAAELR
jgi:hypothetical protein